jgi:hypothetical protein
MTDYSREVDEELLRALKKHGPFPSVKVGFGRLLCEFVELGVELLLTGDMVKARAELIQVCAMCIKLLRKIDDENGEEYLKED